MTWRYAGLALLIHIILALRCGFERLSIRHTPLIPPQIGSSFRDPESLLASGKRIPFVCADIWSLELISGVSDGLAAELLDKREAIVRLARIKPPAEALQEARGVGASKGRSLATFLDLKAACSWSERFEPFSPQPRYSRASVRAGTGAP